MKKICMLLLGLASVPMVQASEDLAKAKNCLTCHSAQKKIVGPSFQEIVAKRAGEKGAVELLAGKIKNGSKDEWGKVPMPANQVSDDEAKTLAKWVLTIK